MAVELGRIPRTEDSREILRWRERLRLSTSSTNAIAWVDVDKTGAALADIPTRPHSSLQSILGVDLTSGDTTKDKHISNGQGKNWEDHRNDPTVHYTDEKVDDRINALLSAGTGLQKTYDDAGNILYLAMSGTPFTEERVDDRVNALLTAGTGLAKVYDDAGNLLYLSTATTLFTQEQVEDIVGGLVTAGTGMTVTYDDAGNAIYLATSATPFSDEAVDDRVAALIQNGLDLGWTYNDAGNTLTGNVNLPLNYIAGLILSNNATDATNDVDIAVGECRNSTDTADMRLASILVKQIDAAWTVGTNAGGMDTGVVASSTLYAVWLIKRSDTGVVDALFSLSFTAPSMPANYDLRRLIGSVYRNASAILEPFVQSGDYFRYKTPFIEVNDITITDDTFEPVTLAVPPNCMAHIYAHASNTTSTTNNIRVQVITQGHSDPVGTTGRTFAHVMINAAAYEVTTNGFVLVSATRQVSYAADETTGAVSVAISSIGFIMLTRKDP